jgi:hypothetical protein
MRKRYRCEFLFQEQHLCSSAGLTAFRDGFWINEDLKFTDGSDVHYWIPPHRILYVAKDLSAP